MCDSIELAWRILPSELFNTLYMVGVSLCFAFVVGFPLGILLTITRKTGLWPHSFLHRLLGTLVNVGRSFPFAILIIVLFPITRWLIGTTIGTTASIIPLSIAASFLVARLTEAALLEVDCSLVKAALVMGSTSYQTVQKVIVPEALPSLIQAVTITAVNLVGYSAMVGLIGGGGLGKVAIQYGYQRFDGFLMTVTVSLLILLVEGVQLLGNALSRFVLCKRGKT